MNDKLFIYWNMPKIADYDVRLAVWRWMLQNHKKLPGHQIKIDRKPNWNFDVEELKKKEYFSSMFSESRKRRRKTKRAADFKDVI